MSDFFENQDKTNYMAPETLEIKLSTAGQLDAPPVLHVTDYTMEDVIKLSTATPDNIVNMLIEVLQARIQEDFDVRLLHENEFEEILMTIYTNFWSRIILNYPYPWEEEELKELVESGVIDKDRMQKISSGEEKVTTDVDLTKVTIDVLENFKEPITITGKEMSVKMRLPRVGDYVLVQEYLKNKFAIKEKKFSDLISYVNNGGDRNSIDVERRGEFLEYEKEKTIEFLKVKQALLLKSIGYQGNEIKLETIEDKIDAYKRISKKIWNIYSREVQKIDFGVNKNVKVRSPFTKKLVTRRCLFQVMDFIPTDEAFDDTGYSVSFGT